MYLCTPLSGNMVTVIGEIVGYTEGHKAVAIVINRNLDRDFRRCRR